MTGNDTEFARWIGVNKSSVSRARKAGRLVLTDDGRVNFEASAEKWHQTLGGRTDVAARHAANRGSDIPKPQQSRKTGASGQREPMAGEDSDRVTLDTRTSAKTALLHYENSLIKLEMALRRGMRIDRKAIQKESHGLGAMLRAAVERVIDQTAPRLAAAGDDFQRRRIIDAEIRRLRWVIKREMPRALRRMKEAGNKAGVE